MNIPSEIRARTVPYKYHNHYKKWLRYYLDFCHKYHFPDSKRESLPHFIKKLQGKLQSQEQHRQAHHAMDQMGVRLQTCKYK